jgi:hypothetical protein
VPVPVPAPARRVQPQAPTPVQPQSSSSTQAPPQPPTAGETHRRPGNSVDTELFGSPLGFERYNLKP